MSNNCKTKYLSVFVWSMFLVLSFSTSSWAAATAQGVALNTGANCGDASLDLSLTSVNAHREYGLVTLFDGTVLLEFEDDTALHDFNGTYVGYGMGFSPAQPPGTVIGSYAYVGETPSNASDTAEFFILYNCSTRQVLYECFGPYGVCPQRANNFTEGTIGTELVLLGSLAGSDFGADKGKVLVSTTPLKVLEWSDGLIRCLLSKALQLGTYDITIRPQAKGSSPINIPNGFTVKPPEIDSVKPTSGFAGDTISIEGIFFGAKKPKVSLDNKTCKVVSWDMNAMSGQSAIQFIVPKELDPGTYDLKVTTTGVGSDTVNFTVE